MQTVQHQQQQRRPQQHQPQRQQRQQLPQQHQPQRQQQQLQGLQVISLPNQLNQQQNSELQVITDKRQLHQRQQQLQQQPISKGVFLSLILKIFRQFRKFKFLKHVTFSEI